MDQARVTTELIPACSMTPRLDFSSKISLAFHQSSVGHDNGDTLCPYVQDSKDEGDKAARYRQQEWSEKVLL